LLFLRRRYALGKRRLSFIFPLFIIPRNVEKVKEKDSSLRGFCRSDIEKRIFP